MTYRVIVTGSRKYARRDKVYDTLTCLYRDVCYPYGRQMIVVNGMCKTGADSFAHQWVLDAKTLGLDVEEEPHPADWDRYGKSAGYIRNAEMAKLGAAKTLAFYQSDAENKGTSNMALLAKNEGIEVVKVDFNEQ